MHTVLKYFYHKFASTKNKWHPILSVYYLTYACSFRCPFCSDGAGRPYHQLPNEMLPAAEVLELLKTIRQYCDYLVITGGEPLQHPEFASVIKKLRLLEFKDVTLTTNGFAVAKYLPAIAQSVTSLVFSLNTLDPLKGDILYGTKNQALTTTLHNIALADCFPKKKYKIHLSTVVTPGNIDELYKVYDFSKNRGYTFAACPQLVGVKVHEALARDKAYQDFYNFLIAEKRKGFQVFGTIKYLETMRDLEKFPCYPFTMLVVSPAGNVYYPCLEIGHNAGNLLENSSLQDILNQSRQQFGPQPACDTRCHSACALGFSTITEHPSAVWNEIILATKGKLRRLSGRSH